MPHSDHGGMRRGHPVARGSMRTDKIVAIGLVVVTVVFLCAQVIHTNFYADWRGYVKWGRPFPGYPLHSTHIEMNCTFNDKPICCALVDPDVRVVTADTPRRPPPAASDCHTTRVYHPSPYEERHLAFAKQLIHIESEEERRIALQNFIFDDVPASVAWLNRIEAHMKSTRPPPLSQDDMEYLSRYRVTKTCGSGESAAWYEWIEPLSVHTRHPFAIANCSDSGLVLLTNASGSSMALGNRLQALPRPRADYSIMTTDYVLLQNGVDAQRSLLAPTTSRSFLFDVGTSTFDSSLFWFLCGYAARAVTFDSVYGWEHTLLEPTDFWRRVPPSVLPWYHFFNTAIQASGETSAGAGTGVGATGSDRDQEVTDPSIPPAGDAGLSTALQVLQRVARPDDFVAFKLDIDTPSVELPVILQILQRTELAALVDELFFELHFRCEFLMHCGWGTDIPRMAEGLPMDRFHAMSLFQQLREMGIRAHFWP